MEKKEERESVVLENHGQKIFGIMHRPLHVKHYPALLICHGLGGHKTGKYRLYVSLAEKLAAAGIASLRIDFRGSGDSEGEFSEMTLESEVSDALKAMDFIQNDPKVDSSRMGLFGRSIGAAVAIMAAGRSGLVKSIAMWAPVFNGEQWLEKWKQLHAINPSGEMRDNMMRINGQIPSYEFFKQLFSVRMDHEISPLSDISILNIHGEKDSVVTIEHSYKYLKAREKAKGETKFMSLPQSDHDFSHPEEQRLALKETCNWFSQTL